MKIDYRDYEPFDFSKLGHRSYLTGKTVVLRNGYLNQEAMIVGFLMYGNKLTAVLSFPIEWKPGVTANPYVTAEGLLEWFDFTNGAPCGLSMNMASGVFEKVER